jgi:hypothetical protein
MVNLLKMVIFNGYVKEPEGTSSDAAKNDDGEN